MRPKRIIAICLSLTLLLIATFLNWKGEVIAIHPFRSEGQQDLKVVTWNVHCSKGADSVRQRKIAEQVLNVAADFVLLNEYNQDSCKIIDSLLKMRYHYAEESRSHSNCGDIFYSKYAIFNSGLIKAQVKRFSFQAIKATITVGVDSIQVIGIHLASNHYDDSITEHEFNNYSIAYERYKEAQAKRCVQAEWIKEEVEKSGRPVIVMGDMNDFNKSKPLEILSSCGLRDSWWEGGNGYGCTFHDGWMRLRIDHILHSEQLELQNIKVLDTNLSDHNPVVAGLSIK